MSLWLWVYHSSILNYIFCKEFLTGNTIIEVSSIFHFDLHAYTYSETATLYCCVIIYFSKKKWNCWKNTAIGLLPDWGLCMRRVCREHFPRHRLKRKLLVSEPGMYVRHVRHARAVMHVGIANPRWRGKRSRHSRRMRNPQFYVSGKRPMIQKDIPYCTSNIIVVVGIFA